MLAAFGLGPAEEEVYRRLVARASADAADLAAATLRPVDDVLPLLTALVERGLATATPDAADGQVSFRAAPPAVTLGALLRRQREDLRVAENELVSLAEQHRAATAGQAAGGLFEVITDVHAVRHRFTQIQEAARHQVRSMVVPSLQVMPGSQNTAGTAGLRRGVRYRAIMDRSVLAEPGIVQQALDSIAEGEQLRVADEVAVKLVIADDDRAMLPLLRGQNTAPASVLVQASGLLDILIAYFESCWERAYPLWPNAAHDDLVEMRPTDIEEVDASIMTLLLAGLTDQAVAGQLDLSLRTVQRRVRVLMDLAGVQTRIQLGWHAARHGWA